VQRTCAASAAGEPEFVRRRAGNFLAYLLAPTACRNGGNENPLASARLASVVLTRVREKKVSVRYAQQELSRTRWEVLNARRALQTPIAQAAPPLPRVSIIPPPERTIQSFQIALARQDIT